jgi:predicted LPLAT superfamily acyltransferase
MNWKTRKERSNLFTVRMARRLTQVLPRRAGRWLLFPTALYFLAVTPKARAASLQFLQRVLPQPPGLRQAFRHYLYFATVVMDRAYLLRDDLHGFEIDLEGEETVEAVRRAGNGGFLVGAHLGSFEALRALGREKLEQPRIVMVMYEENARMINEALAALNPDLQQDIIGLGKADSMIRVKHALDSGAIVGILADRLLDVECSPGDRRIVSFLGRPAAFPVGPFRMAALLKRPVVLMLGIYLGANRYRLVFENLYDFTGMTANRQAAVEEALQIYVRRLEHYSRAYPFNWFNFFDIWEGATPLAATDEVQPA